MSAQLRPLLVRCGEIVLDPEQRLVHAGGRECLLTRVEFELLSLLMYHPNRVFTREALLDRLGDYLRGDPLGRAVDIHVSNLRRKLRQAQGTETAIETVRGVGYRLRAPRQTSMAVARPGEGVPLEQLALAALKRTPVPLLVLSPNRTVLLYNEAAQRLCGWTAEEVTGQVTCYSLLGCHDRAGKLLCDERCALHAALRAGQSDHQMHYVITRKDGRQVMVAAHYSRLDEGTAEGVGVLLMLQAQA